MLTEEEPTWDRSARPSNSQDVEIKAVGLQSSLEAPVQLPLSAYNGPDLVLSMSEVLPEGVDGSTSRQGFTYFIGYLLNRMTHTLFLPGAELRHETRGRWFQDAGLNLGEIECRRHRQALEII